MVCTADDLQGWKDFPKGLRVLLLDQEPASANVLRASLEAMDYVGSWIQRPSFDNYSLSDQNFKLSRSSSLT